MGNCKALERAAFPLVSPPRVYWHSNGANRLVSKATSRARRRRRGCFRRWWHCSDDNFVESVLRFACDTLEVVSEGIRVLIAAQVASDLRWMQRQEGHQASPVVTASAEPVDLSKARTYCRVLMQLALGAGARYRGMIAALKKSIVQEHELAICDIAVGGTLNFVLV